MPITYYILWDTVDEWTYFHPHGVWSHRDTRVMYAYRLKNDLLLCNLFWKLGHEHHGFFLDGNSVLDVFLCHHMKILYHSHFKYFFLDLFGVEVQSYLNFLFCCIRDGVLIPPTFLSRLPYLCTTNDGPSLPDILFVLH